MQYFNRTFFRFAFGFISIIAVSITIILLVGASGDNHERKKICIFECDTTEPLK